MFEIFFVYLFTYFLIVFFSFVSEITYKKKSLTDCAKDYKKILLRSFIYFIVLVIFSLIYHKLNIGVAPD